LSGDAYLHLLTKMFFLKVSRFYPVD
jgi:hypothetical protein